MALLDDLPLELLEVVCYWLYYSEEVRGFSRSLCTLRRVSYRMSVGAAHYFWRRIRLHLGDPIGALFTPLNGGFPPSVSAHTPCDQEGAWGTTITRFLHNLGTCPNEPNTWYKSKGTLILPRIPSYP